MDTCEICCLSGFDSRSYSMYLQCKSRDFPSFSGSFGPCWRQCVLVAFTAIPHVVPDRDAISVVTECSMERLKKSRSWWIWIETIDEDRLIRSIMLRLETTMGWSSDCRLNHSYTIVSSERLVWFPRGALYYRIDNHSCTRTSELFFFSLEVHLRRADLEIQLRKNGYDHPILRNCIDSKLSNSAENHTEALEK